MTTPAKLYGKDLSEYDEIDVDELLAKLTTDEINILAKEVDPDVSEQTLGVFTIDCLLNLIYRIVFYLLRKDAVTIVKRSQPDH